MPTVAELAQQELSRRYSLQGRTQVAPRVQTMQNARPTVRSALSNLMRDAVDATGLEGGYRQGLLNAAGGVETAVDFLPVVGDVLGLEDASRAYGQGDMVGAGINMMGVVPIVGDVAAKSAKSALRGLRMTEDEYISAINPQGTRIAPEARPNLGMGDMYGMAPRNAQEIMTQELPSGEKIRYVEGGDGIYALGYNPDLGEEDVVGYMVGGGDSSELAVVDQMQGQGIGGNLSYLYRSQNPMAQSGGFTEAGEAAARKTYRRINEEARMQRAQDLGFDTDNVFYHGTASDFAELQPSTVGDLGGGVYVTPNPEKASGYAAVRKFMKRQTNNAGPNVLPLRVKSNLNYLDLEGSSIMPFDEARIQSLKDQGYEGIRQFDADGNVIQMNIFDPKNIRSTNAEFDPTKADSADLLSSVGTTSALRGIV